MKAKHQRLILVLISLALISSALWIILSNLKSNIVFFYSPSELTEEIKSENKIIRIGGLVAENSVKKMNNKHFFAITDLNSSINIEYSGILPPMFRENQGMVAKGKFNENQSFIADNLLTKHDENYMPPEVAKKLKESGKWKQ